jgi:hypothetical protein
MRPYSWKELPQCFLVKLFYDIDYLKNLPHPLYLCSLTQMWPCCEYKGKHSWFYPWPNILLLEEVPGVRYEDRNFSDAWLFHSTEHPTLISHHFQIILSPELGNFPVIRGESGWVFDSVLQAAQLFILVTVHWVIFTVFEIKVRPEKQSSIPHVCLCCRTRSSSPSSQKTAKN